MISMWEILSKMGLMGCLKNHDPIGPTVNEEILNTPLGALMARSHFYPIVIMLTVTSYKIGRTLAAIG